jgi:hypothetical protein
VGVSFLGLAQRHLSDASHLHVSSTLGRKETPSDSKLVQRLLCQSECIWLYISTVMLCTPQDCDHHGRAVEASKGIVYMFFP